LESLIKFWFKVFINTVEFFSSGAPPTEVGGTSHFGGGAEPRTESQPSHHSSAGKSRRLSGALGINCFNPSKAHQYWFKLSNYCLFSNFSKDTYRCQIFLYKKSALGLAD